MSGARQGILVIAPPGPGNYWVSVEPILRAARDPGGPGLLSRPARLSWFLPGFRPAKDPHASWYVTRVPAGCDFAGLLVNAHPRRPRLLFDMPEFNLLRKETQQ